MITSSKWFVSCWLLVIPLVLPEWVIAQCGQRNTAFRAGERLSYEVYYEWQFIELNAASVSFSADSSTYRGAGCYHLVSEGSTRPGYDWIFRVRDRYESWAGVADLVPLKANRDVAEGSSWAKDQAFFGPGRSVRLITQSDEHPLRLDTLYFRSCLFDPLAAAYLVRNLDFGSPARPRDHTLTMLLDNTIKAVVVRFRGEEMMNDRSGRQVPCLRFSAMMDKGSLFAGGKEINVWVTNDANRIPFLVEAEILVGRVRVYLSRYEGLRNPSVLN